MISEKCNSAHVCKLRSLGNTNLTCETVLEFLNNKPIIRYYNIQGVFGDTFQIQISALVQTTYCISFKLIIAFERRKRKSFIHMGVEEKPLIIYMKLYPLKLNTINSLN